MSNQDYALLFHLQQLVVFGCLDLLVLVVVLRGSVHHGLVLILVLHGGRHCNGSFEEYVAVVVTGGEWW